MELNVNVSGTVTVSLDATPALMEALRALGEAAESGQKSPKTRTRAAKSAEPAQVTAPAEKAAENVPLQSPAAAPAATAAEPAAAPEPAPAAKPEPAPAAAAAAAPAGKGIGTDEAREICIAVVTKYGPQEAITAKMRELGYESVPAMPDDTRADFIAWLTATYPVDQTKAA